MCGNGVGLGLFPSDSLKSQSYYFDGIEHDKLLYGVDSIKVLSNREIWRKSKSVQKLPFFDHFWTTLGYFLRSQSCDFDAIAHARAPWGV